LKNMNKKYEIKPLDHESFIAGRCGQIVIDGKKKGIFGEISPKVLENWGLEMPVTAFELSLE
jgi:phenylalanyl-tRNA synthetase beta chain